MKTTIRPIKSAEDHEEALERIGVLMAADAGTDEGDELEVLATLVELYENDVSPIHPPSAIEAIKFRLDQSGMSQRDLIPLIGSRSKVSEVLSGKRSLTLKMIRALHEYLEIPAEILLQEPGGTLPENTPAIDWSRFPVNAMAKLGWIEKGADLKSHAEEIMRDLIERAGNGRVMQATFFRKNDHVRQNAQMDRYALCAWCLQVLATARKTPLPNKYQERTIDLEFLQDLARLSWHEEGPKLAKEYLEKHGIHLVFVHHLPRTHLDGAALELGDGAPVIALTVRYDQVDNFWFCLCHELAHVGRHMQGGSHKIFVDDITLRHAKKTGGDSLEYEADEWAEEALIPNREWQKSGLESSYTPQAVFRFAQKLKRHRAIVSGRVRYEKQNYRILSRHVGNGQIRRYCDFGKATP